MQVTQNDFQTLSHGHHGSQIWLEKSEGDTRQFKTLIYLYRKRKKKGTNTEEEEEEKEKKKK